MTGMITYKVALLLLLAVSGGLTIAITNYYQRQTADLNNKIADLSNGVSKLNGQISQLQSLNAQLTSQIQQLQSQVTQLQAQNANLTQRFQISICDYIVYQNGTRVLAKNGKTGINDYSGTDAAPVINDALAGAGLVCVTGSLTSTKANYTISATLAIPAQGRLECSGWGIRLQLANRANVDLIRNKDWNVSDDEGITIENCTLDGNGQQNSNITDVVSLNGCLRCRIFNNVIANGARNGVSVQGAGTHEIGFNKISNNAMSGVLMGPGGDDSDLLGNDVGSNGMSGVTLSSAGNVKIYGGTVFLNTNGAGIDIFDSNRIFVTNVHANNNGAQGVRVKVDKTQVQPVATIIGNEILDNNHLNSSFYGIELVAEGPNVTLDNTTIVGNLVSGSPFQVVAIGTRDKTGGIVGNVTIASNIITTSPTPIKLDKGTGIVVRNNVGYNPVGKISTPFATSPSTMGPMGNSTSPSSNTIYKVSGVDLYFTSSGGIGVSITIEDILGNTVYSPGPGLPVPFFVPVGYQISFGLFSVAPTVVVFGD